MQCIFPCGVVFVTACHKITVHDFIHGDLHPGNILVSGTYPKLKYQVLDCGLALEMGPKQHENIVKVLGALTRKDGIAAGQIMADMKSESQASPEGRMLFVQGIEQICIDDGDKNFIENVGDYITDICSLACIHRVKLEGAFVNAALAVEIMEGLASALDPSLKVQQVALPLVLKAEMMVSGIKTKTTKNVCGHEWQSCWHRLNYFPSESRKIVFSHFFHQPIASTWIQITKFIIIVFMLRLLCCLVAS